MMILTSALEDRFFFLQVGWIDEEGSKFRRSILSFNPEIFALLSGFKSSK